MPSTGGGGAVSCSCWGTITATFTWIPSYDGEPPPASVIIEEDSSVYAYNDEMAGDPVATPQADDGLGDAATVSPGSTFAIASSSGTVYSVRLDPGQSFSINRSPFTFSYATNGNALSSVAYKAITYVPRIDFSGVTYDPADTTPIPYVLTGQQVTATLTLPGITRLLSVNGIPIPPLWTISSPAICFGDFYIYAFHNHPKPGGPANLDHWDTPNDPGLGAYDSSALTQLGIGFPCDIPNQGCGGSLPVNYNTVDLQFFTKDYGSVTLTAFALVVFPDGTVGGVFAYTDPALQSIRPTPSLDITAGKVHFLGQTTVQIMGQDTLIPVIDPALEKDRLAFGLVGANAANAGFVGENWQAKIILPHPFEANLGVGCFAQLVTPGRYYVPSQGAAVFPAGFGLEGLDNQFTYGNYPLQPQQDDNWHVNSPANIIWTPDLATFGRQTNPAGISEDSPRGRSGDLPAQPLENQNPLPGVYIKQHKVVESYHTWSMFKPEPADGFPNQVTTWVPMMDHLWTWGGQADFDPVTLTWGSFDPETQTWGPLQTVNPSNASGVNSTSHPHWTRKITNGQ